MKTFITLKICKEEALKYDTRSDFFKSGRKFYNYSLKRGYLDDVCSHMINGNIKYEFGECKEEALKYDTRYSYQKNSPIFYSASYRNGWLDEVCSHMTILCKKHSLEECKEEALKYDNRMDFYKNNKKLYSYAQRNNCLDEVCSHMNINYNYFTFDECKQEALKYDTRSDFFKKSTLHYHCSIRNGWNKEICIHMHYKGNFFKRFVYKATFPDGKIYIGLTYNLEKRIVDHTSGKKHSSIYEYIKKSGENPIFELISDLLTGNEAALFEINSIKKYRDILGNDMVLNKHNGGGLGGNRLIWTFEKCREEALKYNNITKFIKLSGSAYDSAKRHKWVDEICSHMNKRLNNIKK